MRRDVWFDENWQLARHVPDGVQPAYSNPAYSDSPYPSGYLISGDAIAVPPALRHAYVPPPLGVKDVVQPPVPTPSLHAREWMTTPDELPASLSIRLPARLTAVAWYVELCAGTCSMLRYHLATDPKAQCIAVDIRDEAEVMSYIPAEHRHRVTYIRHNVQHLSYETLSALLRQAGCDPSNIVHIHASPPCTTYSTAHHSRNFHRDDLVPLTPSAVLDDDLTRNMCATMETVATKHPHVLLSQENPVGLWSQLPWVQRLSQQPNWQLVQRMDHCMMTSHLDEFAFPNKPTSYLLYNCEAQPDIVCGCRCDNRLTARGSARGTG